MSQQDEERFLLRLEIFQLEREIKKKRHEVRTLIAQVRESRTFDDYMREARE